jgi:hypothetical protein
MNAPPSPVRMVREIYPHTKHVLSETKSIIFSHLCHTQCAEHFHSGLIVSQLLHSHNTATLLMRQPNALTITDNTRKVAPEQHGMELTVQVKNA